MTELDIHNVRFSNFLPSPITSLSINEKRNRLAVFRSSGVLEIWNCDDLPFQENNFELINKGNIETSAWCEERLFSGSSNGSITEHVISGKYSEISQSSVGGCVWTMDAKKDQKYIIVGTETGIVSLYKPIEDTLKYCGILYNFGHRIMGLSWHPEGDFFTAIVEDSVHICSVNKNNQVSVSSISAIAEKSRQREPAQLCSVLTLQDGTIAVGDNRGTLSFWDGNTRTMVNTFRCLRAAVLSLTVDPQGTTVFVTGVHAVLVQVRRGASGPWFKSHIAEMHTHDVRGVAVDHKGRVYSGGADCFLGHHYFPPKVLIRLNPAPPPQTHDISGDFALLSDGHEMQWWWLRGEKGRVLLTKVLSKKRPIDQCCLSPSGRRAAYSCRGKPFRVCQINLPEGKEAGRDYFEISSKATKSVDCQRILWLSEDNLLSQDKFGQMQVWKIKNGVVAPLHNLPSSTPSTFTHLSSAKDFVLLLTPKKFHLINWRQGILCKTIPAEIAGLSSAVTAVTLRIEEKVEEGQNRTHKKRRLSNGHAPGGGDHPCALICTANNQMIEIDLEKEALTEFGTLLKRGSAKIAPRTAIRDVFWNSNQSILCVHTHEEMLFYPREILLKFNWDSKIGKTTTMEEYRKNSFSKLPNGNVENVEISKSHFVPTRRKKLSVKIDLEGETWNKLVIKENRKDSYVFKVNFSSESSLVCIEMKQDDLLPHLSDPFFVHKFGTG